MQPPPRPGAGDLLAGLSLAGLLLPEAIAYAAIAELPPQHAIFAAVSGLAAYALLGRSRFAAVAPTSSSAAIVAASAASLGLSGSAAQLTLTLAIVLLTGLLFLGAGMLRLGFLADFISRPVLRGFGVGLAATIIIKQLPLLAGLPNPGGSPPRLLLRVMLSAAHWNGTAMLLGLAGLAALLALTPFARVPRVVLVLAGGSAVSWALDLPAYGIATVGAIDFRHIGLTAPHLSYEEWLRAASVSVPMFLMLYAESWGAIRGLALPHGDVLDADRELRALGIANIAAAIAQGMPVGAGFSASSANEAAGARSRLAGACAALFMVLIAAFGRQAIAAIPEPLLAAVVIAALVHALNPAPLMALLRVRRDFAVAAAAALAVLAAGVLDGMLVAIGLSLVVALARFAQPQVSELGQMPDGYNFAAISRNEAAQRLPGIAIFRPDRALFFANAARVCAEILAQAAAPGLRCVILSLEESGDLDSTAAEELLEFARQITARGQRLILARVKDEVRDVLARSAAVSGMADCAAVFEETRSVADAASLAGATLADTAAARLSR